MAITGEGQRCIAFLKSAESDSEKMAALFLVPKLVKAEECDHYTRKQVLEAVGFSFVKRLISTTTVPEGCPSNIYRSIATTLLGCFLTVEELVTDPQMLDLVPILLNTALETHEDNSIIDEVIQCLVVISSHKLGVDSINEHGGMKMVLKILQCQEQAREQILIILVNLVTSSRPTCKDELNFLLDFLHTGFVGDNTLNKFNICVLMVNVIQSIPDHFTAFDRTSSWYKNLPVELLNVISNKLSVDNRQKVLVLVSVLLQKFGVDWANTDNRKLFDISTHLTCVEIRMILENSSYDDVVSSSDVLVACYSIVETAIQFLIMDLNDSSENNGVLYKSITEAMNSIMFSINSTSEQIGNLKSLVQNERLLLFATIRVLGVWLAEETSSLRKEVDVVLPMLVNICNHTLSILKQGDTTEPDLIRFLLPGFSHLVSDESSRNILLTAKIHIHLFDYFKLKWDNLVEQTSTASRMRGDENSQGLDSFSVVESCTLQLETLCNLYLTIVISDPSIVVREPIFTDLLLFFFDITPWLESKKQDLLVLFGNICVLGLFLHGQLYFIETSAWIQVSTFIGMCIAFIEEAHCITDNETSKQVCLATIYDDIWDQLTELWFLAVEMLKSLIEKSKCTLETIQNSGWLDRAVKMLLEVSSHQVESTYLNKLEDILCEAVTKSQRLHEDFRRNNGEELCRIYNMKKLQRIMHNIS